MKSYDIVGYTYKADNYCHGCIRTAMGMQYRTVPVTMLDEAFDVAPVMPYDIEAMLHVFAQLDGIDRYDERTYDSGDFPKVIFADMVHDSCSEENGYETGQCGDQCGKCGEPLGFECPNSE